MAEKEDNTILGMSLGSNGIGASIESAGSAISGAWDDGVASVKTAFNLDSVAKDKRSSALPTNSSKQAQTKNFSKAYFALSDAPDWRVRISIPSTFLEFKMNEILKPLETTGNAMVFPYTPTVSLQSTAGYSSYEPTHSNYPFHSYKNSQHEDISIIGEFTVETKDEAKYWLAARHLMKSCTKMAYGENEVIPDGAPPPICKLNGYGEHIFNNVPVVISKFTVALDKDVDYMYLGPGFAGDTKGTYVPVRSMFDVSVKIIHSRQHVRQFSLSEFVQGGYVKGGEFM
jgi:hypothetical protein